ncbi:unnamed protein product [Calicophoron daubneyi]|uniref:Uncharacterized protein n=1 Tax=Calicophoron daubneyi TaxID=300641 RepID=A0AAV2TTG5_CALDB
MNAVNRVDNCLFLNVFLVLLYATSPNASEKISDHLQAWLEDDTNLIDISGPLSETGGFLTVSWSYFPALILILFFLIIVLSAPIVVALYLLYRIYAYILTELFHVFIIPTVLCVKRIIRRLTVPQEHSNEKVD